MKKLILLFLLMSISSINAQDTSIQWQKTIGGSEGDFLNSLEPTSDGGYILGGYSTSNISGDKTEDSNGAIDIWIVKINALGVIQWQKTIGGSGDDFLGTIKQTSDGGYIVAAGSDSNISGDKTENSRGGLDFWILKLDGSGTILWQHTYGGANPDFDNFAQETTDGGFIVGGYSDSGISGDKTEASNGQRDYWLLKLDSSGAIVWQNGIGGSLVDRVQATFQTSDGGYMIGGHSNSNISGDKSENSRGLNDIWIVKLSAEGNIEWDKTIGGSNDDFLRDMIQTSDGGYLVGSYSKSNISGDKTEDSRGLVDYWVLKLDASGVIQWQKTIGGSGIDYLRDVKQLNDGSYVLAGYSESNISGDKTENAKGLYDFWLIKLNSSGTIVAQKTIGGANYETGTYIVPASDGGFLLACSSDSNISGDKTENSKGLDDYWVFKADATLLGIPSLTVDPILKLYPNPSNGQYVVEFGKEYSNVIATIYTIDGKLISSQKFFRTNKIELTIDKASGVYILEVSTDEGYTSKLKLIKD